MMIFRSTILLSAFALGSLMGCASEASPAGVQGEAAETAAPVNTHAEAVKTCVAKKASGEGDATAANDFDDCVIRANDATVKTIDKYLEKVLAGSPGSAEAFKNYRSAADTVCTTLHPGGAAGAPALAVAECKGKLELELASLIDVYAPLDARATVATDSRAAHARCWTAFDSDHSSNALEDCIMKDVTQLQPSAEIVLTMQSQTADYACSVFALARDGQVLPGVADLPTIPCEAYAAGKLFEVVGATASKE